MVRPAQERTGHTRRLIAKALKVGQKMKARSYGGLPDRPKTKAQRQKMVSRPGRLSRPKTACPRRQGGLETGSTTMYESV